MKPQGSVALAQAQYREAQEVSATLDEVRAKEGLLGGWTPRREHRVSREPRLEGDCAVPAEGK